MNNIVRLVSYKDNEGAYIWRGAYIWGGGGAYIWGSYIQGFMVGFNAVTNLSYFYRFIFVSRFMFIFVKDHSTTIMFPSMFPCVASQHYPKMQHEKSYYATQVRH